MSAQVQILVGGRLHLNHGPIDLICQAWGRPAAVKAGYARAIARFETILPELVKELPGLRAEHAPLTGPIARKMAVAIAPFRPTFITPMAAVAGAVAETVLAEIVGEGIDRAYVNNGGDIALHLAAGEQMICALAQGGKVVLNSDVSARGIATSGWRGRSWSFGIADAVTVLARTAAMADAAATMIANATDLPGHPAILRRPAFEVQADSDLGARLVTVRVERLSADEADRALQAGLDVARGFLKRGLIEGAALFLQDRVVTDGQLTIPKETAFA